MSVQSEPYYWLECDEPDCGVKSTKGGEYTAWSDVNGAVEDAEGCGWVIVDGKHYCDTHIPEDEEVS
jgi:hypothetical protein